MKCPYCTKTDNKVIDSRLSKDGRTIRRRRECLECGRRFTTYEKLEEILLFTRISWSFPHQNDSSDQI